MYSDKTLTCADCGQEFVFTASEQDFYAQRGFTEPRRCASCRASRKAARNSGTGAGAGSSSYGSYGAGGGYSAGVATAATAAAAPAAAAAAEAAATARTVVGIAIVGRGRCSPRPARTAARKPRSRSARPAASPSIARTASARARQRLLDPILSVRACPGPAEPAEIPTRVVSRPGSIDSRRARLPAVAHSHAIAALRPALLAHAPSRRARSGARSRLALTHVCATNAVGDCRGPAPAIADSGPGVVQCRLDRHSARRQAMVWAGWAMS